MNKKIDLLIVLVVLVAAGFLLRSVVSVANWERSSNRRADDSPDHNDGDLRDASVSSTPTEYLHLDCANLKWQRTENADSFGGAEIGYSFHVANTTNASLAASADVTFLMGGETIDRDFISFAVPPGGVLIDEVVYCADAANVSDVSVVLTSYGSSD